MILNTIKKLIVYINNYRLQNKLPFNSENKQNITCNYNHFDFLVINVYLLLERFKNLSILYMLHIELFHY